ncbi:hypothetical protein KTAU_34080 [Thermogemmatispora aurantia]|uniref:DUF2079 domain-containing protein n=1 Tax=Thermogemmatispora aurantia TaxID=2045279 RepID=A0A5J4KCP8_9CHLR|nr:DUF2079 domain-containing protein [Thermogemmatispora aurantia]GER84772.1 hypothetical protein KTAU_34080 [Thermogemmatispora aurantia]
MKLFNLRAQTWLAWGLVVLATVIYFLEMSHQAVLRYDTFKATAFDLGNYDQAIWNTLHGRPFQFTNQAIDWYGPPTRLGVHFEPILLLLALLYLIRSDPRTLLVFQTLVLALGAFPVFLLARYYLPRWPLLAALCVIAYLLAPALLGLNIFDFHAVSLATPLLLYALLALTYRRYVLLVLCCFLAASCKEDVPLAVGLLGLLMIWRYRLPRLGLALFIGGFLWSALAFGVIIPHFFPGQQANNFWYRYETLGSSPGAAIVNLLLHPWLLFTTFLTVERFYYLASLIRNTGFLALLAPEWLIPTLPSLAVNVLNTDPALYSGVYHYNASIIPFAVMAGIIGLRRFLALWAGWRGEPLPSLELMVPERKQEAVRDGQSGTSEEESAAAGKHAWPVWLARFLSTERGQVLQAWGRNWYLRLRKLALRLLQPAWWSRHWQRFCARMIPLARQINLTRLQWYAMLWILLLIGVNYVAEAPVLNSFWADHEPGPREQHIEQLLAMIPPDASVSAGDNLNPHLSERQRLAVFPSFTGTIDGKQYTVDYIIVDLNAVFPEDRASTIEILNRLTASGQFRLIARAEGVVLLKRNSSQ